MYNNSWLFSTAGSSLADCFFLFPSTLKMKAIRSSETSVYTMSTRRHTQQDDILQSVPNFEPILKIKIEKGNPMKMETNGMNACLGVSNTGSVKLFFLWRVRLLSKVTYICRGFYTVSCDGENVVNGTVQCRQLKQRSR
jgi:hypothetical protein